MLLFPCFLSSLPQSGMNISPQIKSLFKHETLGRETNVIFIKKVLTLAKLELNKAHIMGHSCLTLSYDHLSAHIELASHENLRNSSISFFSLTSYSSNHPFGSSPVPSIQVPSIPGDSDNGS